MDKCYSLHGYPPGHKLYKKPTTSTYPSSSNRPQPASTTPALTSKQYNQLIAILNDTPSSTPGTVSSAANLTSISHLSTFNSSNWITDTGASDHVIFTVSIYQYFFSCFPPDFIAQWLFCSNHTTW